MTDLSPFLRFFIVTLAVWRVSCLFVIEDGPFDIFAKIRSKSGIEYNEYSIPIGTSFTAKLLICLWCVSIWVSAVFAFALNPVNIPTYIIYVLALSSGAIIVHEVMSFITKAYT